MKTTLTSPSPVAGLTIQAWAWLALTTVLSAVLAISVLIFADDPDNGYAYALRGATFPAAFFVYPIEWRLGAACGVLLGVVAYVVMRRNVRRGKVFLSPRWRACILLVLAAGIAYGLLSLISVETVEEVTKPQ